MSEEKDPGLEPLLEYLRSDRGFDFTGYKRTSLKRRIENRMRMVGIERFNEYTEYLEVHPEEFNQLFNMILINVTGFFRDQAAWDFLGREIIPKIIEQRRPESALRIWSAGCASGEEAYSLAMLFAEAMGIAPFREHVKIYATDVDSDALNQARQAAYTEKQLADVPTPLKEKYFEYTGDRYLFHKELRRSVIFGRHDLLQDAPISRLDLLVCRNTLMYFNAEAQSRILERFHFALNENGYLFLGKAEMLLSHGDSFSPVDLKQRLFRKLPRPEYRERPVVAGRASEDGPPFSALVNHVRMREAAFDASPVPQIVIDANGLLALCNAPARSQFGLRVQDLGRPLQDLEISYRPVELRSRLEQAINERRTVLIKDIEWHNPTKEPVVLDLEIRPLQDSSGQLLGCVITFTDMTLAKRLQHDLQRSSRELETAYEELQSTNEELETTNEELQSTVEELETTNEELQSTNEELETINEELQSTNEELQTLNQELRQRSEELNQVNTFLESILSGMRSGVAVLDQSLVVLVWNKQAEEFWGLRAEEVRGKHFLNLDIGLPVTELKPAIRACLSDGANFQEVSMNATNRRGKPVQCHVTCTPLMSKGGENRGVILLMDDAPKSNITP
jgi:two-component system CheB/CheR fusion protein